MVKRVAVFAAFDANGKIHRYVQTYLKELKKNCSEDHICLR